MDFFFRYSVDGVDVFVELHLVIHSGLFPELSVWLLLMWSDEEKRDRELCLRRFLHKFVFSTKKEEKDEILLYHTCVQQAR